MIALASPISLPFGKIGPFQPHLPRRLELPLGLIEAVDVATVHFDLVRIERRADTKCPEPAIARTFLADRANLPVAGEQIGPLTASPSGRSNSSPCL